jgi:hypothetical protein
MRALAAVAVATLLLAGCGDDGDDGALTRDGLADLLVSERDMPAEQARCVADQVFARLSEDEIATVEQVAQDDDDLPPALERKLANAMTPCA